MKTLAALSFALVLSACAVDPLNSSPINSAIQADLTRAQAIAATMGAADDAACYAAMLKHAQATAGAIGIFSTWEAFKTRKTFLPACAATFIP